MKEIFYKLETSSTTRKPVAIQYWFPTKRAFECGITWQIFRHEKLHTIHTNKLWFLHRHHQKSNSQCFQIAQKVSFLTLRNKPIWIFALKVNCSKNVQCKRNEYNFDVKVKVRHFWLLSNTVIFFFSKM